MSWFGSSRHQSSLQALALSAIRARIRTLSHRIEGPALRCSSTILKSLAIRLMDFSSLWLAKRTLRIVSTVSISLDHPLLPGVCRNCSGRLRWVIIAHRCATIAQSCHGCTRTVQQACTRWDWVKCGAHIAFYVHTQSTEGQAPEFKKHNFVTPTGLRPSS